MGTQKNRLNKTVLLSTQNTCLNKWVRKQLKVYANKISLSGPMLINQEEDRLTVIIVIEGQRSDES